MNRLIFLVLFFIPFLVIAQDEELKNYDHVYTDNIRSVKFHPVGLELSYPIIDLNSPGLLQLSFDDLEGDVKDYVYSFQHCDADWTPSDLSELEYLDGFSEEDIENYDFGFRTLTEFTHYRVILPNEDMRWKVSGNYLLKVYDNTDDKKLVITRRFMVAEPIIRIFPRIKRAGMVSKIQTHQEVDFTVNYEGLNIRNPRVEVNVAVLQNGRWDNAITDLQPLFIKGKNLIYNYQDKIVFPAGKEFRQLDLRTLEFKTQSIYEITSDQQEGYDVTLFTDKMRFDQPYLSIVDINGNFLIQNIDDEDIILEVDSFNINFLANSLEETNADENFFAHYLEGDYANVHFAIEKHQEFYEKDVYLVGGFTDWQLKDQYKMTYNEKENLYETTAFLKQGFYNYLYAVTPSGKKIPDYDELEGNWFESENEYMILVYYRPFGARYDRIVAAYYFNSNE